MTISIDHGRTKLPLCSCGWRGEPAWTTENARRQAAAHEARAHPEDRTARHTLGERTRRATR